MTGDAHRIRAAVSRRRARGRPAVAVDMAFGSPTLFRDRRGRQQHRVAATARRALFVIRPEPHGAGAGVDGRDDRSAIPTSSTPSRFSGAARRRDHAEHDPSAQLGARPTALLPVAGQQGLRQRHGEGQRVPEPAADAAPGPRPCPRRMAARPRATSARRPVIRRSPGHAPSSAPSAAADARLADWPRPSGARLVPARPDPVRGQDSRPERSSP